MRIEEKVGRVFMVGFEGTEPDPAVTRLLTEHGLGGVIVFARNIRDAGQLARLASRLRELAGHRPILIAADQEGGSVLRVRHGATLLPSAMGLGLLGPEAVAQSASVCGRQMRAMGLDVNLAPVLDVNDSENPGIGIRSFGDAPQEVAACGAAYVQALQAEGVLATLKHFPGKGSARRDSHLTLPRIERDLAGLRSHELVPFVAGIRAGAGAAMTSHCVYSGVEDGVPATLSRRLQTNLLRDELGFEGLLFTDDLLMGAITAGHDVAEAAVQAFRAGADQLLVCSDASAQEKAMARMVEAVMEGRVSEARLNESLGRIERAHQWLAESRARRGESGSVSKLRTAQSRDEEGAQGEPGDDEEEIQSLVDRIVRVVQGRDTLPLGWQGSDVGVLYPRMSVLTRVEEDTGGGEGFVMRLADRLGTHQVLFYHPAKLDLSSDELRRFERSTRRVLFFSANAHLYEAQKELLQRILARSDSTAVVALRNPYDADLARDAATVITAYGFHPNTLSAVERLLLP